MSESIEHRERKEEEPDVEGHMKKDAVEKDEQPDVEGHVFDKVEKHDQLEHKE
jgi:hypothetical protein